MENQQLYRIVIEHKKEIQLLIRKFFCFQASKWAPTGVSEVVEQDDILELGFLQKFSGQNPVRLRVEN